MNNENIIKLEQLPVITEKLALIKQEILNKSEIALNLVCTQDNYKEVKKVRSELNKEFNLFEGKRKEIKTQILKPYEDFEEVYKENISNIYKDVDVQLKERISTVEGNLIQAKTVEVVAYHDEYATSIGIDFVNFDMTDVTINMSTSIKKLKEQVKSFLDKVRDEIKMINLQEHSTEIMIEYKTSLDFHKSVFTVVTRKQALKLEEDSQVLLEEKQAIENEIIAKVEEVEITAPVVEEISDEELENYILTFEVVGTINKLKLLKKFLEEGGYNYESI